MKKNFKNSYIKNTKTSKKNTCEMNSNEIKAKDRNTKQFIRTFMGNV